MQTLLTSTDLELNRRSLALELADADARQLLDIGLVRAADGSLRLAEDPMQAVAPQRPWRLLQSLEGVFRWLRSLSLRSPNWDPHFFVRE
jgi:hypothetical protein